MKITFGLVVYNEEGLIKRCLESIKDVADEIIIVHDGSCSDKTLEIASQYTNNLFVRERLGGSEPHRIFILQKAKNDWVFMIDADEFLSDELKYFLNNRGERVACGAISFKWPIWNGQVYATKSNYRPCLFNKKYCWAIGLHNFSIQTQGKVCRFNYILEHQPKESKIGMHLFSNKLKKRIDRDANRFLLGYGQLEKFNEELIPNKFKSWYARYLRFPFCYAFINFFVHFIGAYKSLYRDGIGGFKVSLQLGVYQFKLAIKIWNKKREQKLL